MSLTYDPESAALVAKLVMQALLITGDHIAWSPPNPPPSAHERVKFEADAKRRDWGPNVISWFPQVWSGLLQSTTLVEMYLILCHLRPEFTYQPLVSFLAPLSPPSSPSFNIGITAAYAVGWAMMYGGAQLRLLCYRTLGRNFTYQLSVRKDHELVTSGPYKIVRHPSYTAAFTCFFGRTICMFGPGSWFIECGVGSTKWGKVLAGTWAVLGWIMSMLMLKRVGKEDEVLKETFKSKWEAWAKETPNVFIPYIY